jgi:pimeloyl-ACP methyl ester carboxylesterase
LRGDTAVPLLELNGRSFFVRQEGSGPVLVLLHGFPLDHSMWDDLVRNLRDDYTVIAIDQRGFGRSRGGVSDVTSMDDFADDLNSILDELGVTDPITLAGLSMGGYVSFAFLRKYASRVSALILCDTRSVADTPEAANKRLELADRVLTEGAQIVAEAMLPRLTSRETREDLPQVVDALRNVMLSTPPRSIAAALRGMAARPDVTEELANITVPTLVLVGEQDEISPPEEMRELASKIPNSQFVIVPKSGHMTTCESPAFVNAKIREFLKAR